MAAVGEVSFLQKYCLCEATHVLVDRPIPMHRQVALSCLSGLKKKEHIKLEGKVVQETGEKLGGL